MDAATIMAITLLVLAALCLVAAVRGALRTHNLNQFGRLAGVKRWEGENNDSYQDRIQMRIKITGGKRW